MADSEKHWDRLSVSALEADVAYFDAKLVLLREQPASCYRAAQIKAYQELETVLTSMLLRLNSGLSGQTGSHSGDGEVREDSSEQELFDSTLDDISDFNL